jgi:hypothetical protein
MLGPDQPGFSARSSAPPKSHTSLSAQQSLAVHQFVARVGGLENARRALEMLAIVNLRAAADDGPRAH